MVNFSCRSFMCTRVFIHEGIRFFMCSQCSPKGLCRQSRLCWARDVCGCVCVVLRHFVCCKLSRVKETLTFLQGVCGVPRHLSLESNRLSEFCYEYLWSRGTSWRCYEIYSSSTLVHNFLYVCRGMRAEPTTQWQESGR